MASSPWAYDFEEMQCPERRDGYDHRPSETGFCEFCEVKLFSRANWRYSESEIGSFPYVPMPDAQGDLSVGLTATRVLHAAR
jgi:hypothetical protein